ncbi:MAG: zinc ribbon domain-containing protein [Candidatus Peribacteria bacterium]|nr:MAG: zinc ribbon domain-containing protein [Candidatus Peribacteria bacterium]
MCLSCGHRNNPHHTHCVFCGEKIHIKCRECHQPYPASYAYCPECGAPNIDQLLKENR